MREKVTALLLSLGVTDIAMDPLLDITIDHTEFRVLNETNTALPMSEDLESIAVSLAAAAYLRCKKTTGGLDFIDLDAAVKQIQEGDTNIHYAIGEGSLTPEQRLDQLIGWLESREAELCRFRKLVW